VRNIYILDCNGRNGLSPFWEAAFVHRMRRKKRNQQAINHLKRTPSTQLYMLLLITIYAPSHNKRRHFTAIGPRKDSILMARSTRIGNQALPAYWGMAALHLPCGG
jgi:hypothetical protein